MDGTWVASRRPGSCNDLAPSLVTEMEEIEFGHFARRAPHSHFGLISDRCGPDGKRLFVIGWQRTGELVRWDASQAEFIPFLKGISAYSVSFSRDSHWVAYLKYPDATLWRMRPDGSVEKQLTFSPMETDGANWSPDGKAIAIRAKALGRPFK